jgi:hypothetical protein
MDGTHHDTRPERRRELNPHRALLESLFVELFQTERSAEVHLQKEAERLGDTPPASALRAIAQHAISVNAELPQVAGARDLSTTRLGTAIGDFFSLARRTFTDPVMESERSYRASLLGARHGVDLVKLVRATADAGGDAELVAWCTEWLSVREPLVEAACAQLEWFGWHPEPATRHVGGVAGFFRRLVGGHPMSELSTGGTRA